MIKSFIPSSRVRVIATLPSSFPGINDERIGLIERSPAITPISKETGPSRLGMLSECVDSCREAGPLSN